MIKRLLITFVPKLNTNGIIVAKQCPPLPKPTLVKFISKQLLQVLDFNAWGMRNVP
jgi:hypothetical protein